MTRIDRIIHADFMKLKRTPLLLMHLLLPLIGMCTYSAYAAISILNVSSKISGYFQVLGMAFPTVIGVICAMVAEQELMAGNGFHLFVSSAPKAANCASKLIVLAILGLCSTFLATFGFYGIMNIVLKQNIFPLSFYFIMAIILFACNMALYLFHFWLSLRFGKGASIGIGIVESLIAALMVTGLGTSIWYFIPCAWSTRMTTIWTFLSVDKHMPSYDQTALILGTTTSTVITLLMLGLFFFWFARWEGRRSYD